MLVEPMAGDRLEDNLNAVGRIGAALGAQADEKRPGEVIRQGGFGRVRKATATPLDRVLEARVWSQPRGRLG